MALSVVCVRTTQLEQGNANPSQSLGWLNDSLARDMSDCGNNNTNAGDWRRQLNTISMPQTEDHDK